MVIITPKARAFMEQEGCEMTKERDRFIEGYVCACAAIANLYHQDSIAVNIFKEGGFVKSDLRYAVDADAKIIRRLLK